jgi:hypothetical protein
MQTLIPCEICNTNVAFENYIQHCEECYIQTSITNRHLNVLNNGITTLSNTGLQTFRIPLDIETIHHFFNLGLNGRESNYETNLNIEEMNGGVVDVPVKNLQSCYCSISDRKTYGCTICLDDTVEKEYVKTTCNHIFCKSCIDRWFNMKHLCPICKYDFNQF